MGGQCWRRTNADMRMATVLIHFQEEVCTRGAEFTISFDVVASADFFQNVRDPNLTFLVLFYWLEGHGSNINGLACHPTDPTLLASMHVWEI